MDIKQGSLLPAWSGTVKRIAGAAVDLTGATVYFRMANAAGTVVVDEEAEILDAEAGTVQYEWQDGDTDTVGRYTAEIHVVHGDGTPEVFPNKDTIRINVFDDVPGTLWSPNDLTGVVARWRADDEYTLDDDGGGEAWVSRINAAHVLTQATASKRLVWQESVAAGGGRPAFRSDGVDDFFGSTIALNDLFGAGGYTILVVCAFNALLANHDNFIVGDAGGYLIFEGATWSGPSNDSFFHGRWHGNLGVGGGYARTHAAGLVAGEGLNLIATWDGTTAEALRNDWSDAENSAADVDYSGVYPFNVGGADPAFVGDWSDKTSIDFFEIVVLDQKIVDAERARWNAYVEHRYGITKSTTDHAWTPADIPGVTAVWDATHGTTLGAAAQSRWRSKVDPDVTATQATAASRPTIVWEDEDFNGDPSVSFDGVNDLLTSTSTLADLISESEYTIFAVMLIPPDATTHRIAFSDNPDGYFYIEYTASGTLMHARWDNTPYYGNSAEIAVPTGEAVNVIATFTGTAVKISVNGVEASTPSTTDGWVDTGTLTIGGYFTPTYIPLKMRLSALAFSNQAASDETIGRWNAYVADRFGI